MTKRCRPTSPPTNSSKQSRASNQRPRDSGYRNIYEVFSSLFRNDINNNWFIEGEIADLCNKFSYVSVLAAPVHLLEGLNDVRAGNPLETGTNPCSSASIAHQMIGENTPQSVSIGSPTKSCTCRIRFENTSTVYFVSPILMMAIMCKSASAYATTPFPHWTQWFRRLIPQFYGDKLPDSALRFCAGLYDTSVITNNNSTVISSSSSSTARPQRRALAHFIVLLMLTTKYRPHDPLNRNVINMIQLALSRFFSPTSYNRLRSDRLVNPLLDSFLYSLEYAAEHSPDALQPPINLHVSRKLTNHISILNNYASICPVESYRVIDEKDESNWWFTSYESFTDQDERTGILQQLQAAGSLFTVDSLMTYQTKNPKHTTIVKVIGINAIQTRRVLASGNSLFVMDAIFPRGISGTIACMSEDTHKRIITQSGWRIMKYAVDQQIHTVSITFYLYAHALVSDVIAVTRYYQPSSINDEQQQELPAESSTDGKDGWRLNAQKAIAYRVGSCAATVIIGKDPNSAVADKMKQASWDVLQQIMSMVNPSSAVKVRLVRHLAIVWLAALCDDTPDTMIHLSKHNRIQQLRVMYDYSGDQAFLPGSGIWEDETGELKGNDDKRLILPNVIYHRIQSAEQRMRYISIHKPVSILTETPIDHHARSHLEMCRDVFTVIATVHITQGDTSWNTFQTWLQQMTKVVDNTPRVFNITAGLSFPTPNAIFRDRTFHTNEKGVSGVISSLVDSATGRKNGSETDPLTQNQLEVAEKLFKLA